MKRFTIERRIQLAFLLAFITLSLIGYFSYHSVRNLSEALKEEKETQQILQHLSETMILVLNSETGGRGYALTGNNIFLEPFDASKDKIKAQLKELQLLLKDNPEQTKNLKKLELEIDQKLNFIKTLNDVRENADVERTAEIVNSLFEKKSMDNIRQIIKGIEDEETNTLKIREESLAANLRFTYWILLFGSIGGVFSIGLANLAIFLETVKRTKAEKELKETNKNLETRVEERTLQLSAVNQELEKNSDFVRATLDSLSAHIAVVDRTGKILVVNEQWEKFSNMNEGNSIDRNTGVGENYLEVCRQAGKKDKIAANVFNNLSKILEGKRQTYRIEYPCHSPDEERWFILQINPLVSENGGAVISHFDITDRKKIENELR
ncbi:MAG TPA: CHASE3 domain-containing protein, partial [Pyrinomonadaceae bacterium]|nr:CHASE3 domain-containing protein [Pyrinomonadaceae bacterium]